MKKILVIGSACADVSLYVDHLPSVEEDVQPRKQKISLGGCACNAAGILQLFDVPFTLFAPVGTGIYGSFVKQQLNNRGIEPVLQVEEENGACYCIVDDQGNRTFIAMHGAEYLFRKKWFDALDVSEYSSVYACGLELEEKTGDVILSFLEEHPELTLFFAPGPRITEIPEERMNRMLALHPIVHCNRREASAYLGHPEYTSVQSAEALHAVTGNTVIITDGGNPAVYVQDHTVYSIPACECTPVDGTGAGDSHIGAVMAMLQKGCTLSEAVETANWIGAAMAETEGTQLSSAVFSKVMKGVEE